LGEAFKESTTHPTKKGKVFSNKPFDMKSLKYLDLKLELLAEKMLLHRVALNNFHLQASIKDGGFAVDSLNQRNRRRSFGRNV
jgi:hypothetical protein